MSSSWPSGRRVAFGIPLLLLSIALFPSLASAQTSGIQSTGGDGSIFGFAITPSQIAYTTLAALICPVLVSAITTLDTKGYQKMALNVGLALLAALGSWFVDKYGTNQLVIQTLSIFIVASGIYAANKGGFTSLTANVGRKGGSAVG